MNILTYFFHFLIDINSYLQWKVPCLPSKLLQQRTEQELRLQLQHPLLNLKMFKMIEPMAAATTIDNTESKTRETNKI